MHFHKWMIRLCPLVQSWNRLFYLFQYLFFLSDLISLRGFSRHCPRNKTSEMKKKWIFNHVTTLACYPFCLSPRFSFHTHTQTEQISVLFVLERKCESGSPGDKILVLDSGESQITQTKMWQVRIYNSIALCCKVSGTLSWSCLYCLRLTCVNLPTTNYLVTNKGHVNCEEEH